MKRSLVMLFMLSAASVSYGQPQESVEEVADDCWGFPDKANFGCKEDLTAVNGSGLATGPGVQSIKATTLDTEGLLADGSYVGVSVTTSPTKADFDSDATDFRPMDEQLECDTVVDIETGSTDCIGQVLTSFDKDGRPLHTGWKIRYKRGGSWFMKDIYFKHIVFATLHGFCGSNGSLGKMFKFRNNKPDICGKCNDKFSAGSCRNLCNVAATFLCGGPSATPSPSSSPAPVCNLTTQLANVDICSLDPVTDCSVYFAECGEGCAVAIDEYKANQCAR